MIKRCFKCRSTNCIIDIPSNVPPEVVIHCFYHGKLRNQSARNVIKIVSNVKGMAIVLVREKREIRKSQYNLMLGEVVSPIFALPLYLEKPMIMHMLHRMIDFLSNISEEP